MASSLSHLAGLPVSQVKGMGGKAVPILAKAGIMSVADLLHHVPRTYVDRTDTPPLSQVPLGSEITVIGEVKSISSRRPKPKLVITEARIADDTASITAVWFNQRFREKQLPPGTEVAFSGSVESYRGKLQMTHPEVDILDHDGEQLRTGRIVPIYSQVGEVKTGQFRSSIHNALTRARPVLDPLPDVLLAERGLMSRDHAYAEIHFPETLDRADIARNRLVYDELFRLELALALRKRRQTEEATGFAHTPTGELVDRFVSGLPYQMTGAQRRVIGEIVSDLREAHPMHRLLHGEVGSGKTVVAVVTLLHGVEGGWQGAIMAPTEVLADQHYLGVTGLLAESGLSPEPFGVSSQLGMDSLFGSDEPAVHIAILTGSTAAANYRADITRSALLEDVASGQVDILVGTHALIQEGVHFSKLGVVVVDEQHRFGVAQRVMLKEKAESIEPDLLIMTATPIPRTLSMTLYGDLDVSGLDEMPPGRIPVETTVLGRGHESRAWKKIEEEVASGRQAFVVCPLVEDSPKIEAASATAEHQRLSALLPGLRVGLIHGQLKPADKDAVMSAFRSQEIDVLVSTTVIEVGIDVPNATVMVIEDADRFGLSQLHQLRGRVGRGEHPGVCLLIADAATEEAEERLAAMVATNDGFELANVDLMIRGQGTVFGTRQSGMADLRLADIIKDFELLSSARHDAFTLVDHDPDLSRHPELAEEIRALLGDSVEWLFKS
ncbi:MAG TPA: ATP-dependent DNA helicase RecG [Acidimicrobiia bacterium]|nr:ATP-dependent DNA helicase RecG [Acidimicrobiia bacterium]